MGSHGYEHYAAPEVPAVINPSHSELLHDGDKLVAEYDGAGNLLRRYVHGPGTDEPVAVYEGPSLGLANRRYMLPDERGSIIALVNPDGTPSVVNRYDPWGVPGPNNRGRFQYTAQAWIPELGLYYYKARFYSPPLGRFLQVDPIGYEDQMNLYTYVGNDPVNFHDPDGLRKDAACIEETQQGCTSLYVEGPDKVRRPPPGTSAPTPSGRSTAITRRGPPKKGINFCKIGNDIMFVSDAAGDGSLKLTAAGLLVAGLGVVTGQGGAVAGGGALAQVGGVVGIGAGVLQVAGGLAQGAGGGGYKNAVAGAVSLGTGVLISKGLRATIPRGWHGASKEAAERNNDITGNAVGALQGLADWLAPTQVECPR